MTAAALRAAERLGVSGEDLAAVLDVPESTVSRMRQGGLRLEEGSGAFERGIPFVRLFRPLDAVTGGGGRTAHAWLRNENRALGGRPLDRIRTAAGLAQGLAYLDSARARL